MPIYDYPADLDILHQSIPVPGTKAEGTSEAYKSSIWDQSILVAPDKPRTLQELFDQSVARHPDRALFLRRSELPASPPNPFDLPVYGTDLIPTTYAQFQRRRDNIGSALLALERSGRLRDPKVPEGTASPAEITFPGVPAYGPDNRVKNGARRGWAVGVWSKNREEWQAVDFACHAYGLVGVSYYETLGPDVAEYITNHCPISIVFASVNHLADLLKIAPRCPSLRVVVSMDKLQRSQRELLTQWAQSIDIELLELPEFEAWGAEDGVRCDPGPVKGVEGELELDINRIATISYTSGTTGNPKGVVLTNKNVTTAAISNAHGASDVMNHGEWRFLSFLPLSHIFERFLQWLVVYGDGTIAFTTGDPLRLLEDAQLIKPQFMAGVPRVFNRIHAAVQAQMHQPGLKGALLTRAVNVKLANWRETGEVTHKIYDALVFRKIRNLLGGNLLLVTSGAAPLAPDVHEMLKICFSCDVIQGYGMTETVGTCTRGIGRDITAPGTCGQIQPINYVKLFDVPEMGYTSADKPNPRGEVCIKGFNITPGYLHDPENTAKTVDAEGWLHTGDVGEIDAVGRLKIVDRIKNVVKLSQGEYVALEKLEGMYALDPIYATLLVHGDSTRSSLVAIGVLDPIQGAQLISSVLGRSISQNDLAALEAAAKDPKIKKAVLQRLLKTAKKHKLNGFEQIKAVYLTLEAFPDEIMTPTLKVKRNVAAKKYKDEIDAAYLESESAPVPSL